MDDDERKLIFAFLAASVIGLGVGIFRGIIQEKYSTWLLLIRGICASILVAIFVGFALEDTGFSMPMKFTIIGISSFIADDILMGLLAIGRIFGNDPFGFIARVFAAYRGQLKTDIPGKVTENKREDDPK